MSGWAEGPGGGMLAAAIGVVPQQVAAALLELLSRPGVPAIAWGLAA